jgi:ketosteroid isomerase-like protein
MKQACTLVLITVMTFVGSASPESAGTSEREVRKTLSDFIQAFDNLDWERFRNFFAEDAKVFYPREFPRRADGRPEFETNFQKVFERIRAGRSKGPYQDIQPRDLEIQIVGDVAIATFHLDDRTGLLNRRTLVLQKRPDGWKIIHLHASEVAIPDTR